MNRAWAAKMRELNRKGPPPKGLTIHYRAVSKEAERKTHTFGGLFQLDKDELYRARGTVIEFVDGKGKRLRENISLFPSSKPLEAIFLTSSFSP